LKAAEAVKARLWAQWRGSWKGLERAYRGKVRRHFHDLRKETLGRIEQVPGLSGADVRSVTPDQRRDLIAEMLFDIVAANDGLIAKVGPLLRDGYRLGGNQAMKEAADAQGIDTADPFVIENPRVRDKLRRRTIRATGMNTTLRRRLAESLANGLADGETTSQLQERVRAEFKVAHSRAASIARTEVGAAVEEARHEGQLQGGVPLKSWLWSRRETGRSSHRAAEAATADSPIPVGDDFTIPGTGVTCPHPRATGRPEHDINCGCTTLSRFPGDSLKGVLSRYVRSGFLTYEQLPPPGGEDLPA